MKRLVYILLSACLVAACHKTKTYNPDPPKPPTQLVNFIVNGKFDTAVVVTKASEAVVGEWRYLGGWSESAAEVRYLTTGGVDNSPCLAIIARSADTDVKFAQKVVGLDPNKPYKATARIKTEGVVNGIGGQISLDYLWAPNSPGVKGTSSSWRTVTLDLDRLPDGTAIICLRLGNTANASHGVVYFDNITLTENTDLYVHESDHIKLVIDKSLLSITPANVDIWLRNLDKQYEQYVDLMSGLTPFDGRKMVFRSFVDIGAWAYAGEPIQWNAAYIASELSTTVTKSNWSFGLMHEMGHNFATHIGQSNYSYNWNEELFANFRMYLALIKSNGTVYQEFNAHEYIYHGAEIENMYKSDNTGNCYDDSFGKNIADPGNGTMWTLIRLGKRYDVGGDCGYNFYKRVFAVINQLPRSTSQESSWNNWQKFNYFLDICSEVAGEDVRVTYSAQELNLIQTALTSGK